MDKFCPFLGQKPVIFTLKFSTPQIADIQTKIIDDKSYIRDILNNNYKVFYYKHII